MKSLNKVMLIGNVGIDPDVRVTQGGTSVAFFSLATNQKWKDKNGDPQEKVEWHRVKAFGKLADIVGEYVSKGDALFIEGQIRYSSYTDKEGVERYGTDIMADNISMLGGGRREDNEREAPRSSKPSGKPSSKPVHDDFPDLDEDIPFN